jgi:glutathione S-transferase
MAAKKTIPKTSGTQAPAAVKPLELTISSKNYSSWSLRAWLMLRMAGLEFSEHRVDIETADVRAELLLLAPSILVPCLNHNGVRVWDTLAIGEYLNEIAPAVELLPSNPVHRAHCRSICGEMHSGFTAMRASLPMNLKLKLEAFKVWSKAQGDIDRIVEIWSGCLQTYRGPFLFGTKATLADAMYAPVATRFETYAVSLPEICQRYRDHILSWDLMKPWIEQALLEEEELDELDMDF